MISVIIPVYNAAGFVGEAVQSTLMQAETAEVILVEDGSEDNSLEVCQQIATTDVRIRLLQHEGGVNKGAGPSRNLGIQAAQSEWIAFLDADDYYLPHRFRRAVDFLNEHPDYEGVAEAIGAQYEDEEGKKRFLKHLNLPVNLPATQIKTGMLREVPSEKLFEILFLGKEGHISPDGLVVKKSVVQKTGYFNDWQVGEDSNYLLRLAYFCRIKIFDIREVVAIRRIHSSNRWNRSPQQRFYYHSKNVLELMAIIDLCRVSKPLARKIIHEYVRCIHPGYISTATLLQKGILQLVGFIKLLWKYPVIIKKAI
jgi:glycosyltransferase involved in cell wall biosynthesis